MSEDDKKPLPSPEFPEPLLASEGYSDWRACLRPDALELTTEFSHQFRVTQEESMLSLVTTVAHALGESMQVSLPHGSLSAPFSWLAITSEHDPVWTSSLLRYLHTGLKERAEYQSRIIGERSRREAGTDRKAEETIDPARKVERLSEAAGLQILRQIANTVTRDNPTPPFPCSPIDRVVSLVTPPGGLLKHLSKLSPLGLLELEESLMGMGSRSVHSGDLGSSSLLSFIWQIPSADIAAFSRQHDIWLRNIPFVVTLGRQPSFPCIETNAPVLQQLDRLSKALFHERHTLHGNPRKQVIDAKAGKPVMRFLDDVGKWQAATRDLLPLRWVADLGLRISLSLMRLEEEQKLDARLVENGLELAKHLARRKIEIFSASGWTQTTENAETADLNAEERRAYLRICETNGLSTADLRRSRHGLTADERDRIVAKLLSRGLIRKDGRLLRRNAA